MKKNILFILFLIANLTTIFASGVLRYEILKPAQNPLPKDIKTMVFVYRNISFAADSITHFYQYNEETYVDTTNYKKELIQAAYMGFRSVMEEHYSKDTIPLIVLDESKGNIARTVPSLSWMQVNEICKRNNSDILISLDDIVVFNNYQTWYDGAEYNGVADISSFHTWTVYDPLTESYLYEETKMDSLQAYQTSYALEHLIRERLPNREEIMKVVAFSLGENLAKKLTPQWETIYREYYNRGNKQMRAASLKVKKQEWKAALQIWNEMQQSSVSNKYKARAAFNSAIIYERIGEIEQALVAVQQSVNIYKQTQSYKEEQDLAEVLKHVLLSRKREIAKLDKQQSE